MVCRERTFSDGSVSAVRLIKHQHSTERERTLRFAPVAALFPNSPNTALTHSLEKNQERAVREFTAALGFMTLESFLSKTSLAGFRVGRSEEITQCMQGFVHTQSFTLFPELSFLLGPVSICQMLQEAGNEAKREKPEKGTCDDLHNMQEISAVENI